MADLSLDAYIAQSGTHFVPRTSPGGGLGSRLGAKNPRGSSRGRGGLGRGSGGLGRGSGPGNAGGLKMGARFNVVGLNKARTSFDARQKLSNPSKVAVQDARQKISPKTVDARQMLDTKKEKKAGLDVRNRIESSKARKVDARTKINIARQAKDLKTGTGFQKITPPGSNSSQGLNLMLSQGSLTKTIHTTPIQPGRLTLKTSSGPIRPQRIMKEPDQMEPLTRTVDNSYPVPIRQNPSVPVRQPAVHQSTNILRQQSAPSSNLVITRRNTVPPRPLSTQHAQVPSWTIANIQQAQRVNKSSMQQLSSRNTINMRGIRSPSSEQWTGTESTLRSGAGQGLRGGPGMTTMVSVKNDKYHDEEEDETSIHHGGYRHPLPASRTAPPPSVHPTTVWEAIQSVTTKRPAEPHAVPVTDTISPLQGYRVLVTNLHPVVSQDDIIELFGAVGALKKARLIKPGTAEVVFVTKEEALAAVRKYHLRELDSLPMQLVLTSRGGGPEAGTPQRANPTQSGGAVQQPDQPAPGGPLKLGQLATTTEKTVDPSLIHKALFKTQSREEGPVRPVTFTVKI